MSRRRRRRARERVCRLAGDPGSAGGPSVAPLRCPTCNAPVPLGEGQGDVATCVACGTAVPLPAGYRALRDADGRGRADRAEAEALYRRLGRPPSKLLEIWTTAFVLAAGAVAAFVYLLVVIGGAFILLAAVLLALVAHGLADPLGIDFIDRFGGGTTYAVFAAGTIVLGVLPTWLAGHLQSSGELRLTLQANLAAKSPERPGFPATCRQCGAALDVGPGQLGVCCAYCGSDNLVALPDAWVARAGERFVHFHRDIVVAAAQAATLRTEALGDLKVIGVVGVIAIVLMAGLGRFSVWLDQAPAISYADSMGPPRVLFTPADSSRQPESTSASAYGDRELALRDGEVLELVVAGAPCPSLTVRNMTSFPLLLREDVVPWGVAADGSRVARYVAPYTGLFVLDLAMGDAAHDPQLRWRIAPAGPVPRLPAPSCE